MILFVERKEVNQKKAQLMILFVERKEVNQKKAQLMMTPVRNVQGFLGGIMKLVYLSRLFYEKYPRDKYPEMLHKEERPYICLTIEVDGRKFGIPIRHRITHKYSFITVGDSGLDYTKAVLIESDDYLSGDVPVIDTVEWRKIQMNEHAITKGFREYLKNYKHALAHKSELRNNNIIKYSSLQYFKV